MRGGYLRTQPAASGWLRRRPGGAAPMSEIARREAVAELAKLVGGGAQVGPLGPVRVPAAPAGGVAASPSLAVEFLRQGRAAGPRPADRVVVVIVRMGAGGEVLGADVFMSEPGAAAARRGVEEAVAEVRGAGD